MAWFMNLPGEGQAAIVAAITALILFVIRDLILRALERRRKVKETAVAVYRKYADPMAVASENLLWRFKEVFSEQGWGYLDAPEPTTKFEDYKKCSTIYRLAVLIAWIRALRRELVTLALKESKGIELVNDSILSFEKALADGPHIELERLDSLCRLWDIVPPEGENARKFVGRKIENNIKRMTTTENVDDATQLTDETKMTLCEEMARIVCDGCNAKSIPESVLLETKARAIRNAAIREAWLYRDWQAGIGDLLIREIQGSVRRFEVVGYREFEQMMVNGTKDEIKWLDRLRAVLDHLNVEGENRYDARVNQVRSTMFATARMTIALNRAGGRRNRLVPVKTLELANQILRKDADGRPLL